VCFSLSPILASFLNKLENKEEESFHGVVSPRPLLSAKDVFESMKLKRRKKRKKEQTENTARKESRR